MHAICDILLQGVLTYNRVEAKREMPKLKLISNSEFIHYPTKMSKLLEITCKNFNMAKRWSRPQQTI